MKKIKQTKNPRITFYKSVSSEGYFNTSAIELINLKPNDYLVFGYEGKDLVFKKCDLREAEKVRVYKKSVSSLTIFSPALSEVLKVEKDKKTIFFIEDTGDGIHFKILPNG